MISFNPASSGESEVYQLPVRPLPGKLHYFTAVPRVRRMLGALKPDVLLAYYVTGYGTLASLTGFRPLVLITSGSDILVAPSNWLMNLILRCTLNRADLVTAWESHMADAVAALGVTREHIFVLPRGIPYREFAQTRAAAPKLGKPVSIISTRSLGEDYHIDRLIKAVKIARDDGLYCHLTIAGDGPCKTALAEMIRADGLQDNVRMVGFVANDRLGPLLAQHDLYVSLIESDGVSASLLEAMAVGLLPIVPDHPANRAWIESGNNGLLLTETTPEAISECIRQAAQDPALRARSWEMNAEIVSSRADLFRNAHVFCAEFKKLVPKFLR